MVSGMITFRSKLRIGKIAFSVTGSTQFMIVSNFKLTPYIPYAMPGSTGIIFKEAV